MTKPTNKKGRCVCETQPAKNETDYIIIGDSPVGIQCSAIGNPYSTLEYALAYADLGLRVHPCHSAGDPMSFGGCSCGSGIVCANPGKHPMFAGWPKVATTSEWWIHQWFGQEWPNASIGIVTGRGLAVIDVDARHGGFEQLAKLEAELGPLPRDWTVQTGGGGLHIYLRVPKNVGQLHDLAPGVEVKYTGKSVIAPPSRHESGERYAWLSCQGEEPPRMPKAWLAKAKRSGSRVAGTSQNGLNSKAGTSTKHNTPNDLRNAHGNVDGTNDSSRNIVLRTNLSHSDNSSFDEPLPAAKGAKGFTKDQQCRINAAILRTRVTRPGTRNKQMMELARSIRSIPRLAGRPYWDFLPALWRWFDQSKDNTQAEWEGVKAHWQYLWDKWVGSDKWDDNKDPARQAYSAAMAKPLPEAAKRYADDETLQRLAALCCELEQRSGAKLWYLSARKAADVIGVSKRKAHTYMKRLIADGIIEKANEHKLGSPKAQRYRYVTAGNELVQTDSRRHARPARNELVGAA